MNTKRFLIASLAAAGFGQTSAAQDRLAYVTTNGADGMPNGVLEQAFAREHLFTLAGHRSHSSHSSHSSHRSSYGGGGHFSHTSHTSHRSSSYGGYDYPSTPVPAASSIPRSSSSSRGTAPPASTSDSGGTPASGLLSPPLFRPAPQVLTGRSERFKMIVCRVQLALTARDIYFGAIDCAVGPQLRDALRKFQQSQGINQTGTITAEVLDRLMVSTE